MVAPKQIRDQHGRVFDYLRIAVIERCNLRCLYCMPEQGVAYHEGGQLLTTAELLRVVRVAAGLGVRKVRLTGGEPLLRKDVVELVAGASRTEGIDEVHLTTNGALLEAKLQPLLDAGLAGVNLSLDTLRESRFRLISRRSGLDAVLSALRVAAVSALASVKVNMVVLRGVNDDEIVDFARLTTELPATVRFIELMPFDAHQVWRTGRFFGAERIVERLRQSFPQLVQGKGSGTETQLLRLPGAPGRMAVIPAYTRSLCGTCNRIRLTADGQIRNCLFSDDEFDVRRLVRQGASDAQIAALFQRAMGQKLVDGWAAQRKQTTSRLGAGTDDSGNETSPAAQRHRGSMTQIGG